MVREHRKEFFDRDYSAREAYGRLWQYARKYWPRLALGVICGVLTAGTLVPMFSMIQPVLAKVESHQERKVPGGPDAGGQTVRCSEMQESRADDVSGKEARKLLKEYGKIRVFAEKLGIKMEGGDDALNLQLLFSIVILLPLLAFLRLGLVFLNHYCLAWAGMKTVRDIRCDLLHHAMVQSMQFHGRISVGQLMSRCVSDPQQVQHIIQTVLQELAQAPFEIAISFGFIIWTAASNGMLSTLVLLAIGFPLFMLPVLFLSKVIRKWSRKAMERFALVGNTAQILQGAGRQL